MILTEQDARKKRCQESFGDLHQTHDGRMIAAVAPRGSDPVMTSPINCIGSACMAWRWFGSGYNSVDPKPNDLPELTGYCGKAGKP